MGTADCYYGLIYGSVVFAAQVGRRQTSCVTLPRLVLRTRRGRVPGFRDGTWLPELQSFPAGKALGLHSTGAGPSDTRPEAPDVLSQFRR